MTGSVNITKVKFEYSGFNDVRQSPALAADLVARAERVASAATNNAASAGFPDAEFKVITTKTKSRTRVIVVTANAQAELAEATDRSLTRAMGAAGG